MEDIKKYYLIDVDVKPEKMKEFNIFWEEKLNEMQTMGMKHIGTFHIAAGEDNILHLQTLIKFTDFDKAIRSEVNNYSSGKWAELTDGVRSSILHLEEGDKITDYYRQSLSDKDISSHLYYWMDIELKANMQNDFLADIVKEQSKMNQDLVGTEVATFTVLMGAESTTHIKRLCLIDNPSEWFEGECHHYHSDFWEYLAHWSKTTLLEPATYSHLQ